MANPENPLRGFFRGVSYPFRGFGVLTRYGLWRRATVPMAVNAILLLVLLFASYWWVWPRLVSMLGDVEAWFAGAQWSESLWAFLEVVVWISVGLLTLRLAILVTLVLGRALAGPFLDLLSQRIETELLGRPIGEEGITATVRGVAVSVMDVFWVAVLLALIDIPLLLVGWFTGPVVALLAFTIGGLYLAHEFVGMPLTRAFMSFRVRWRLVFDNFSVCVGFGISAMLLMLIPILNFVLLPVIAAGGTALFCQLLKEGHLDWLEQRHLGTTLSALKSYGRGGADAATRLEATT